MSEEKKVESKAAVKEEPEKVRAVRKDPVGANHDGKGGNFLSDSHGNVLYD